MSFDLADSHALTVGAYAAHRGFKALLAGLSFIHDEDRPRGFVGFNLVALAVLVAVERRHTEPLVPPAIVMERAPVSVARPWMKFTFRIRASRQGTVYAEAKKTGNAPGHRVIHGIGTPASREREASAASCADRGCSATKRRSSSACSSASRVRSSPAGPADEVKEAPFCARPSRDDRLDLIPPADL